MPAYKTQAIILNASDYSESSRLLSLLTPDEGRVRLIAKGVRGAKSKFRGSVEPLSRIEVRFSLKDPHGLGTLIESRLLNPAEYLRNDLSKYVLASVMVELIDRTTHAGEGHAHLFAILQDFLDRLRDSNQPQDLTVRSLAAVLQCLGFRPQTERCVSCGQSAGAVAFSVASGGIVCDACRPQAGTVQPFDRGLQRALDLLYSENSDKAERLKLTADQTRRLLNLLLDLAQYHLEVRLNSRIFLAGLQKKK